ncbi:MAG: HmuY family protein [Candidatus Eisenbacteria bacterium]
MNRKLMLTLPALVALAAFVGCSDDDDKVTDPPVTGFTEGTVADGSVFVTSIDGSNYDDFSGFSFANSTITHAIDVAETSWDLAFRREDITSSSAVEGARLSGMEFGNVGPSDVPGDSDQAWQSGGIAYAIDDWYSYADQMVTMTKYVYSMKDASGEHWVKFRVDAVVGATGPGNMGSVEISYFYQDTANSLDLDGTIQTATIVVGDGTGFFDFSTGQQVTPANPSSSNDWDIAFNRFTLSLNGGASGNGECAAFYAYTELPTDPTAIEDFLAQPEFAQTFPDTYGSALSEWYNYNGATHELTPKDEVYLIKSGGKVYKVELESYYGDVDGQPVSALYRFRWAEVQ